jgi:hypothetical protein
MRAGKQARYERQERQKERAEFQKAMTPKERIDALDRKFGPGLGASRERARYGKQITKEV